ncbi:MAG: dTDP-glucose 4,6-dehydratase [Thermoplasmatales archaeon]|jgi:dTDP-glucose 4,6-dehydratase|nr:dTDP-glucose 4,6-dehydratase [Candidatus Thermoplasmatota archaeon]MDA8056166.1 dTDP-glucose 4,6-dehydratase [Thermoplasmatales archaeon]
MLVTGGCGFIGSNFINYWLSNHPDDSIVNLDKMTYAADENYIDKSMVKGNFEFVKGDIADRNTVLLLAKNAEVVVNFAAESHVDRSITDPSPFIKSNNVGVFNLLEASRKYELRFHQISTDEVFGSLPIESVEKFDEDSSYNPRNPYSATKAAADLLARSYYNTYGMKVTISNCSNNFGPHQHPEKLIPKTILHALSGKKIPIYGNGDQVRDWIYVEDHIRGVEAVLKNGKFGETYLFSSENEISNLKMVKKLLKSVGKDESLIEFVADRPGHDVRYALDPSKARKTLGWNSVFKFDDALKSTVEHYVKLKELYQKKMVD